jgi:threonine dehydratase
MTVPENGLLPPLQEVRDAAVRLQGVVRTTPLQRWEWLSSSTGGDVHLKLECWQRTGSFKLRGAYNAISRMSGEQRARGIVTASAGNHGQAVACAARELGAHEVVFVPRDAPELKQLRIRQFGAELRAEAADYDDAERMARAYAAERDVVFVHAFSDSAVIAGQATVALEILAELPRPDVVVVPVGGGGLAAGIGLVLRAALPATRVIGVQSSRTRAMYEAFRAGRVVDVPVPPTLADGLAGCTDEPSYRRLRAVLDELVLVEEDEIADAIRALLATEGVLAEGAGAVAAAAVLSGRVQVNGAAALVVSGGNIDVARLGAILGRTQ